ncbi:hypothetical protein B296_00054500 [Ensete ventricosum]|uniref:Uncharacterized protein n=1 Tax=Ensete ventricosum TaxID=4639 RepID=A0A426WYF6_ENSVE|nr:hypothetical protein B296_00054500 [Ensete ventricosum]
MARPPTGAVGHGLAICKGAVGCDQGPLQGQPPVGVAAHSMTPVGAATCSEVPAGAVTCSKVPTHSDDRVRAQRPWVGLLTRWSHEMVPPARRGCRPRATMPGRGKRQP